MIDRLGAEPDQWLSNLTYQAKAALTHAALQTLRAFHIVSAKHAINSLSRLHWHAKAIPRQNNEKGTVSRAFP